MGPCFLLGRQLCTWLTAIAMPWLNKGQRTMHHQGGQNSIPHLLSIPSGCEWERKCGVTVCVRMITFPFGEPLGIWNRLGYSESVNAADHTQRGGDHPKGSGLPDFRVRHVISRRLWKGNLGSSWGKRTFFYSSLFIKDIPATLSAPPVGDGTMHSQQLVTSF